MNAFLFSADWQPTDFSPANIESPLGIVRLQAEIHDESLSDTWAATYALKSGARLFTWNSAASTFELLLCEVHPELPSPMSVLACHAAIWRVRALSQSVSHYRLSCKGETLASCERASPCSGQGLEAQEWSNGRFTMTIGTQDTWALLMHRDKGGVIPSRWTNDDWSKDPEQISFVEYESNGFVLKPPVLEPGEIAQFHFVVSWASEPGGDIANWYAVDTPPAMILAQISPTAN